MAKNNGTKSVRDQRYGKKIEEKIHYALENLGCQIQVSTELDLRYKVDMLIVEVDDQRIENGIALQITTRRDPYLVKARIAKLNALKVSSRFVFLYIVSRRFDLQVLASYLKSLFLKMFINKMKDKAIFLMWKDAKNFTIKNL